MPKKLGDRDQLLKLLFWGHAEHAIIPTSYAYFLLTHLFCSEAGFEAFSFINICMVNIAFCLKQVPELIDITVQTLSLMIRDLRKTYIDLYLLQIASFSLVEEGTYLCSYSLFSFGLALPSLSRLPTKNF